MTQARLLLLLIALIFLMPKKSTAQEELLLDLFVDFPADTSTFRLFISGQELNVLGIICQEKTNGVCEYNLVVLEEQDCIAVRRWSLYKEQPEPEVIDCLQTWDDQILDIRIATLHHDISMQVPIAEEKYLFLISSEGEFIFQQMNRPFPLD